jgi:tape measure domain-containing protein
MATLKAMFRLMDGYSSTIDKIDKKTTQATDKILKASGQTDKFNQKLNETGDSAGKASTGIGKMVGALLSLAAVKKGIDITDNYINTAARLNLINDGLQTQSELQDKIFAAADRAKGSYASMADAVAKLQLNAGDQFKSNDETIAFTELLQKSFKIGGTSTSEQSSAMLQLTQAMGAGKLQGDEFRSIMENAPMVADAIAKYMGKSKGELKELSSKGEITADIIKAALFAAGDDINAKFKEMPMTFADVWNKVSNGATKAFGPVMEKISELINSDGFLDFIDNVIVGFYVAAQAAEWLIDTIVSGWDTIGPILAFIGGVLLVIIITKLLSMIPLLLAQAAAWLAAYGPIILVILIIIGIISIVISAARQMGATWEEIFSVIGGIIGVFATHFYNKFVWIWNMVAAFINFFGNVFTDPVAAIKALFFDLASSVVGQIEVMAKAIEDVINKIPGVEVNLTGGLKSFKDKLEKASADIKSEAGLVEYVKSKEFMDYSDGYKKGSEIGSGIPELFTDSLENLKKTLTGDETGGSASNPVSVKGTGKNGAVNVNMDDDDLEYLRDIAERDYINKFSTATLAPNVTIKFGDVHQEADVDKLAVRMERILQEQIAVAAEGGY